MPCDVLGERLSGYLDRELDERAVGQVEAHLRACVDCTTRLERERRVRDAVQTHLAPLRAPESLRQQVRGALSSEVTRSWRPWVPTWAATAAALILGLASGWQMAKQSAARSGEANLVEQVVASHVRSLQAGHLTDVASLEHHTVKPWFTGKLDFSPPVQDFSEQGYPLAGARLDYVAEQPVAALVYRRRQHVINLFVWPKARGGAGPRADSRRGFHAVYGVAGGMAYWAVSDLNLSELAEFARLVAGEFSPRES